MQSDNLCLKVRGSNSTTFSRSVLSGGPHKLMQTKAFLRSVFALRERTRFACTMQPLPPIKVDVEISSSSTHQEAKDTLELKKVQTSYLHWINTPEKERIINKASMPGLNPQPLPPKKRRSTVGQSEGLEPRKIFKASDENGEKPRLSEAEHSRAALTTITDLGTGSAGDCSTSHPTRSTEAKTNNAAEGRGREGASQNTGVSKYPRPKNSNMLLMLGRIIEPIEGTIQVIHNAGECNRLFRQHFSNLRLSTCSSTYGAHDYAREGWTTMSKKRSKKPTTRSQIDIINCYALVPGCFNPPNQTYGNSIGLLSTKSWRQNDTFSLTSEGLGMILLGKN